MSVEEPKKKKFGFINMELLDDEKYKAEKARVAAAAQAKRQNHNDVTKAVVRTASVAVTHKVVNYAGIRRTTSES